MLVHGNSDTGQSVASWPPFAALIDRATWQIYPPRGASRLLDGVARTWIMLSLAAVLPLLLSGGWVASYYAQQARANIRHLASDTVERVAERLADELSGQLQVAEALAASTALDSGNLETFRQAAARVLALHPLWRTIELTAPSGTQVLNMLRADGATLGQTADLDRFRRVLETDRRAVGSIGPVGPVSGRRLVTVRVPVLRGGTLRYVLSFAMAPDSVATILKTAGAPTDWIGVVVDASGHIIARSFAGGSQFGERAGDTLRAAMARAPTGTYAGRSREGVRVETVYRALPSTVNWTVAFGIPASLLEAPVRRALYIMAAVGGAGLALDAANLGTWRWDMAPDRFDGSPRCRALLGLPPDAPGQPPESWQDVAANVHPDDRPVLQSAIQRCRQDLAALQCEFRMVDMAGEVRWMRMDGRVRMAPPASRAAGKALSDVSAANGVTGHNAGLSPREEDVLRLTARGFSNKEIAARLDLSIKTVETYRARAVEKLALRTRADIVRYGRQGWLDELGRE